MSVERSERFEDIAPTDLLDLFDELGLPRPNPLWYVGRLDERPESPKAPFPSPAVTTHILTH